MHCQTMTYDRRFQHKLARALFQFPEESRQILDNLNPQAFTVPAAEWLIRKLQWSWQTLHTPATETVLKGELHREKVQKVISAELQTAVRKFLKRATEPVKDKTYLFDSAHDFCRLAEVERFFLRHVDDMTKRGKVDWARYDKDLQKQAAFGARVDGDLGTNFFANLEERIARRNAVVEKGIPTGTLFDAYFTQGGLGAKQIGAVMATTGRGKTSCLVHFGSTALLAGKNVLHITLEVDEKVIADRYDARFSEISLSKLHKCPNRLRRRIQAVAQHQSHLQLRFWPTSSLTFSMLRTYLRRLEAGAFYPDLILLDYADLMSKSDLQIGSDDRDYAAIGEIYQNLRGVAGEFNVPIWTATQANRTAMGKKYLDHSDIADSFRKAQILDVLLAFSQNERDADRHCARFQLLKNRNGPSDITHVLEFDLSRAMIGDEIRA
jgi:DnaB-like helicase C terminal domain